MLTIGIFAFNLKSKPHTPRMYICYVDESGDTGIHNVKDAANSGSPYFILAGLVVPVRQWKTLLATLKGFRKQIAAEAILAYDVEFHCADLIGTHKTKAFTQIAIPDRWRLIERFTEVIGQQNAFSIIAIVIDKRTSALHPTEYLIAATTGLYQAFDEFLLGKKENGLVFFDRANEKHVNSHVRKLMGTGSSGQTLQGIRIGWVIEDPIFRVSSDSIFIQGADAIAYTLKEQEFPQGARKKFNADRIFKKKLYPRLFYSQNADADGIIRK